jgi:hypothetical protein
MKLTSTYFLLTSLFLFGCSEQTKETTDSSNEKQTLAALSAGFVYPPNSSKPGAFWCWLNGDVTKESITYDLEEMKDKGMSGAEIWDIEMRNDDEYEFGIGSEFLGDESVELIQHALAEGIRLDLRMGLIASSGWNAGGAWVTPDWAAKALYTSEIEISGGQTYSGALPMPELAEDCPVDEIGNPIYSKEVAVIAIPDHSDKKINKLSDLVLLNDQFDGKTLNWEVPKGNWTVLRFVCLNTGQHLIVPSPNSNGLFIDFFNPSATKRHLKYILDRLGISKENAKESGLAYMEFDSMELDEATAWTDAMDSVFKEHHGYDIIRYLPAFSGWELPEGNDQFLYDFKKTVSDQIIYSHYTTGRDFLAEYGMDLVAEAGGPGPPIWESCPVDALKALGNVSVPRGEFWVEMWANIYVMKEVASASHIYGLGVVDAESFTTWRRWKDAPHALKKYLDRAFCEGLNRITYVSFNNTRPEHGFPGRAIHAGADINPAATWWQQSKPFMDYMSRCSYLLSQGKFVGDVAYYYGDGAPKFFPELQGDSLRPMIEGLSAGYDFDVVNTDVILNRMESKDGKIVFPDGLKYQLLVLPDIEDIPDVVIEKVEKLIEAGANVLVQNTEVAQKIKGKILTNRTIDNALNELSIAKDFIRDEDKIDFIHRNVDGIDIYFVSNKTNESIFETVTFRASNQQVEYWSPVTSEQFKMTDAKSDGQSTEVKLQLAPRGSAFIVFSKEDRGLQNLTTPSRSHSAIDSPWKLSFPENWGAPASIELDQLVSWTDHEEKGIKYFSGTADYENIFSVSKETLESNMPLTIDLGEVYDLAEVFVNGKSAGILWTYPYQLNIEDLVKKGENQLRIEVTNLWINRLTGDLELPEDQKFCKTNVPYVGRYERLKDKTPRPLTSGLLGPVKVWY